MASSTLADVALTGAWQDLTVTHASLISASAFFQNPGVGGDIAIVFGGADPTSAGKSGVRLAARDSIEGAAANVWARSLEASGRVAVTLL